MATTAFQADEFPAMGWHSSSWDLRQGLDVTEMPLEALPADWIADANASERPSALDLEVSA
jgi:hypothetical protein